MGILSTLSPLGTLINAPSALAKPSPLLADNIDPETRDYRSLITGEDPIDAAVQVAMSVARGSGPAVVADGMDPFPSKLTEKMSMVVDSNARRALRRLRALGHIRIKQVEIEASPSIQAGVLSIKFVNLRSSNTQTRTMRISLSTLGKESL